MKKQLLSICIFSFCLLIAKAQVPPNDECSGAIEVFPSNTYKPITSNLEGATSSDSVPEYWDVWYKFVATTPAVKIITRQSSHDWKSINYLYPSCGGPQLLRVDQSASSGIREDLIPGNTYYYRYQAVSQVPKPGETFSFGVVNLPVTAANDLPGGRTPIVASGTPLRYNVADYLRGRHNVYYSYTNCNTANADSTVIDAFFKFTATNSGAGTGKSFTLIVDDSTWTSALEVVDSSALGFLTSDNQNINKTCYQAWTNMKGKTRIYELANIQIGKTYTLRVEIGGTTTSPVGHSLTSSPALGFGIIMNTMLSVDEPWQTKSVLYPNPNSGRFTIKHAPLNSNLEIMDVLGRTVHSTVLSKENEELNLQLQPGIYVMFIQKGDNRQVIRMEMK